MQYHSLDIFVMHVHYQGPFPLAKTARNREANPAQAWLYMFLFHLC